MISVLVIEDDTQISRLIESTLTAEGYHCECALDGQIGADCIEEKVYDLILLDLMLPQISGYELSEHRSSLFLLWDRSKTASGDFVWVRMII